MLEAKGKDLALLRLRDQLARRGTDVAANPRRPPHPRPHAGGPGQSEPATSRNAS